MAITVEDIAREANVSIATVSRVINNTKTVSPELYSRVSKVIKEKQFRPNVHARGLITKKTKTIGLVVPDISNTVFGELTKGINRACQERGYSVFICESDGNEIKENKLLDKLRAYNIDGVLFAGVDVNETLVAFMHSLECPTVLLTQEESSGKTTLPTVSHNNTQAVYDAVSFLLGCGHRRIAFIGGPENDYSSGLMRLKGYKQALADFDIEVIMSYIEYGDFTFESGHSCMMRLYEENTHLPTAVMACSDLMAIGAMKCAQSLGLAVPDDISFIGFDDLKLALCSTPQLTTVRIPYFDEGVAAAETLFDCINNKSKCASRSYVPHKVIRRASVRSIGEPIVLRQRNVR